MKTRNGFVSNSSSCSFVVAFNPNYKKVMAGNPSFDKIIELYDQKENARDTADEIIDNWLEGWGWTREQCQEEDPTLAETIEKIDNIKDQIPKKWKWAEIGVAEGVPSHLLSIIETMADVNIEESDIPDDYDFDNSYMILVHKGSM